MTAVPTHPNPFGMTILIDGYNIIKSHHDWKNVPLLQARQQLTHALGRVRWPFPVKGVVVVFDGSETCAGSTPSTTLCVQFAAPSADDYLLSRIRSSPHPERLAIVSSDGEILRTAISYQVTRYRADWLIKRLERIPPNDRGAVQMSHTSTRLRAADARAITEELIRHWLGDQGDER